MVEFVQSKREFLAKQFTHCEKLFCDMNDMGKDKAMTHDGVREQVPKARNLHRVLKHLQSDERSIC